MDGAESLQERIRERIERMPALNAVVLKLLCLTSGEDYSFQEVAETLASDASLAARVLRVANSAYYGLPRRVESLGMAVSMIGIRAVTYDLLNVNLLGYGLEEGGLWAHSLAASLATAELCDLISYPHQEEMRLVALLHDVGKVVLSPFLVEAVEDGEVLAAGGRRGVEMEDELLGINHAEVSSLIADRWNLSPRFVEILRCHHAPEESANLPRGTAIVNLADTMVRELIRSEEPFKALMELDREALRILHLTEADLIPHLVTINSRILEEIRQWTGEMLEEGGDGERARAGEFDDEWGPLPWGEEGRRVQEGGGGRDI
ncbi:MAG: HDOD domain-containing protein [Actinomycetota bacterium]|nr:HDOD domain-containing protein [Actinomycetota bacterium]